MKAKWATVDVTAAAKANPNICDRLGFVRALQDLEGQGKVTIKATQVMNRFRLLKHAEDMDAIAPDLYKKGVAREDQEIGRLENVISWCTMDGCLAAKLAAHFGDKLQGDADKCGHCSTCKNGDKPIEAPDIGFDARLDKSATFDEKRWKAVLAVADLPKDDARLIARFALGYTSPRLTALKLTGKHAVGLL
jgi:ATP-dependent DNA helicase RecQ